MRVLTTSQLLMLRCTALGQVATAIGLHSNAAYESGHATSFAVVRAKLREP